MPGSGRRSLGDRHIEAAPAQALIGDQHASILDAIGTLDHERKRHAGRSDVLRIAQQRRHMHGLTGAVDAAFGHHECVKPLRRWTTCDPAIGQIERRSAQIEEGIVAARIGGDQQRRRRTPLPARKSRLEQCVAIDVGLAGRQHLVVAGDKPHIDPVARRPHLPASARTHARRHLPNRP